MLPDSDIEKLIAVSSADGEILPSEILSFDMFTESLTVKTNNYGYTGTYEIEVKASFVNYDDWIEPTSSMVVIISGTPPALPINTTVANETE